ncbi:hypothetical protein SJ05684_b51950 (plasmid) [Sinorhizobium sojae CCBAU 05684]|uniref:Uncharacterized protein n=1 Tax=Sinorhizobium sojae CCBAU 05684 TaxID=716928 RepID=A0A249PKA7_9HYPH|nr:hypothetical protein SJ05684_b51950 [Sinorhizobium sojae CCBAU 05684]
MQQFRHVGFKYVLLYGHFDFTHRVADLLKSRLKLRGATSIQGG